jgi:nucleotide-binding universal stress UspA family protein
MSFAGFLAIIFAVNLVCAVIGAFLASRSGRDPFGWVIVCAVLGPIGLIGLLAVRGNAAGRTLEVESSGQPGTGSRVLVPVDGSPHSLDAVRHAIDQREAISEVVLLAVLPLERAEGAEEAESSPRRRALEEDVTSHTAEALDLLRSAGVAYRAETRFGDPATEILRFAEEAGAEEVIMGRRGRGGIGKLLLGSVSDKVTKDAPMPVTVVS